MSTVYLCIGTPKTGTTALQSFMRENEKLLNEQGYAFPQLNIGLKGIFRDRNAHFLVNHITQDNYNDEHKLKQKELNEKAYSELEKCGKKFENIILSDEQIWYRCNYEEKFWERLKEDFGKIDCKVKVVVYLRRQDMIVQSLWNQLIKMHRRKIHTFEESLEINDYDYFPLDYFKQLKNIEEHIGKDNLIVRVYEKKQLKNQSLYEDYFDIMGVKLNEKFTYNQVAGNVGLTGNYIEIKRIINGVTDYRKMEDFLCRPIINASIYGNSIEPQKKVSFFSYDEQIEFLNKYEKSNNQVAKYYLNKNTGLFEEEKKEFPKWKVDNEKMYRDVIISMTEVFCRQQQQIQDLQNKYNEISDIRKELDEEKRMLESVYNSAIFRLYRKIRYMVKKQK